MTTIPLNLRSTRSMSNATGVCMVLVSLLLPVPSAVAESRSVPADAPPSFVPFGAYLSWERSAACAKHFGVDRWTDVCRRLDALHANHFNLLWVTNMAQADLPRLIDECGKRNLKLVPSMSVVEAKIDWRWAKNSTYYDSVLPRLVKVSGKANALVGWVLSDEPKLEHLSRVETLRRRFRALDPNRFCTAVTMWPQTPDFARRSRLPVICVDLYPFFGPNDPNGPHTEAASKSFFRRNAARMVEAIGTRDAVGWVMGMCFSDIWGPRKYDDRWHLIGLRGAYLHWRAPTLAEMRWQVWETFRNGAKGFVCYTLAPEAPTPETATLPPPDVKWRRVLAKSPTDLGPNALTNPDGSPTPQLNELGRVFQTLAPHAPLLRRWRSAPEPLLEVTSPGKQQGFVDPTTGARYAVILNDDLKAKHTLAVRVGEDIAAVTDLLTRKRLTLHPDFVGGSSVGEVALDAGEGTILQLGR